MDFLSRKDIFQARNRRIPGMKFKEWLSSAWIESGGLISQAHAAKILEVHPTRINQMIKEKKIRAFRYDEKTILVSLNDIMGASGKMNPLKKRGPESKKKNGLKRRLLSTP